MLLLILAMLANLPERLLDIILKEERLMPRGPISPPHEASTGELSAEGRRLQSARSRINELEDMPFFEAATRVKSAELRYNACAAYGTWDKDVEGKVNNVPYLIESASRRIVELASGLEPESVYGPIRVKVKPLFDFGGADESVQATRLLEDFSEVQEMHSAGSKLAEELYPPWRSGNSPLSYPKVEGAGKTPFFKPWQERSKMWLREEPEIFEPVITHEGRGIVFDFGYPHELDEAFGLGDRILTTDVYWLEREYRLRNVFQDLADLSVLGKLVGDDISWIDDLVKEAIIPVSLDSGELTFHAY